MDNHFVYIIYSEKHNVNYKGYSHEPEKRLKQHNAGLSKYTSKKRPWELVFLKSFETKREALQYELKLKRQNHKYIFWLINSGQNEINH